MDDRYSDNYGASQAEYLGEVLYGDASVGWLFDFTISSARVSFGDSLYEGYVGAGCLLEYENIGFFFDEFIEVAASANDIAYSKT